MNLSESRAIKGPQWLSNMILRADDINFTTEAFYGNLTDQLALRANIQDGDADTVLTGLVLEPDTLLTCKLKHGAAVSANGYYLADGTWGWVSSPGDIFSVIVPEDTAVVFDAADPTNPRIDVVEIRPVEAAYNSKSRQFKDPVTEIITSQPTNTKREYGVEVGVVKGTPGASPSAPVATAGWIKIAEVTIPATATTIREPDIQTYRGASNWTTENTRTLTPRKAAEPLSFSIPTTYSDLDVQKLINEIAGDMDGQTVTLEFANGTFASMTNGGFTISTSNGRMNLTSLGTSTIDLATGNIQISGKELDIAVSGFAFKDGYLYIDGDKQGTIAVLTNVSFDQEGNGDTPYQIRNCERVEFSTVSITDTVGSTMVDGVDLQECVTVNNLPTISATASEQPDYHVRLTKVRVVDSSNLSTGTSGTTNPASSKFVLLDTLATQPNVSAALSAISGRLLNFYMVGINASDSIRAASYDPNNKKYIAVSNGRDFILESNNGLPPFTEYATPAVMAAWAIIWSPVMNQYMTLYSNTGSRKTADYTTGAGGWTLDNFGITSGSQYGYADDGSIAVVVGGSNAPLIATSTGGAWTARTATGAATQLYCVVWSTLFSKFFAGDNSGNIIESTDGITWSLSANSGGGGCRGIAEDPISGTVVVGHINGNVSYTTNGSTWTLAGATATTAFGGAGFEVAEIGALKSGGYIARTGNSGHICQSGDGVFWQRLDNSIPTGSFQHITYCDALCVPKNGNEDQTEVVIYSYNNVIATSRY